MNEVEKKIIALIRKMRPYLQRDGGDLRYVSFKDGVVYVELLGACIGCQAIDVTLKDGIEAVLTDEIPEVIRVELSDNQNTI